MRQIILRAYGKVQGVFFRHTCQKVAQELGITGFVKNCEGGCVEILANGDEEKLQKLYEWAKIGPLAAKVERLEKIEDKEVDKNSYHDFEIRY